jgi:hypothetical protein
VCVCVGGGSVARVVIITLALFTSKNRDGFYTQVYDSPKQSRDSIICNDAILRPASIGLLLHLARARVRSCVFCTP